jgi:D-3-phosphoglycerate dehydrogenase / 2-oxoglutarate reductase
MKEPPTPTVLITDYAWADVEIERGIIEGAGFRLLTGSSAPAPAQAIAQMVHDHQPAAILTCWAQVSAEAIAASRNLRIVARLGIGLDNIAVDEATRRGVWVTNVPAYCVEEVSDHAVAMVLAWARGLLHFDREVKAGRWEPATARLRRVSTLTCGIVGYGRIGQLTAHKLRAGFGVRVLAYDLLPRSTDALTEFVPLDELLSRSDAVIVHVPSTPETRHLIDRKSLALMRPGAFLVNVSRGAIVDTDALIEALQNDHLSGAGLDVLEHEPAVPAALASRPDVILTPHVAFSSDASLIELRHDACEEVVRVLRGEHPLEARNAPDA